MAKAKMYLGLGIWIAVLPYLGFPLWLKNILFSLTGLFVMYLSYKMYLAFRKANPRKANLPDNFSENNGFKKEENNPNDAQEV